MEQTDDYSKCKSCDKPYGQGNRIRLGCPSCKNFARCRDWFKDLKYICGFWYENWGVPTTDGGIEQIDLDYLTPRSDDMYTVYIINDKGNKFTIRVNKHKTFRTLMAMIRLKIYKMLAHSKGEQLHDIIKKSKEDNDAYQIKFFEDTTELLETSKISTIGNGTTIRQTVKYIGG